MSTALRRFRLIRYEDVSGVSGTGVVAEGVQFTSGKAALSWFSPYGTVAVFDSTDDIITVHGHGGRTRIEWIDPPEEVAASDRVAAEVEPGALQAPDRSAPRLQDRVARWVLEDLAARRRAGADDSELTTLLAQPDRGGLDPDGAAAVVANLDDLLAA